MSHDRRPDGLRSRITGLAGPVFDVVLDSVDPDDVIDRVDVAAVVRRIDVDDVVQRIDVDELLARVDVDALLARVDVDALLARVDVDALLARVDVDRVLVRVDVAGLVDRAGVPDLVRASTQDLAGRTLDGVRRYAVGVDVVVTGALQRLFRRDPRRLPPAPPGLLDRVAEDVGVPRAGHRVSGRYAGLVTRLLANSLDAVVAVASFTVLTAAVVFVLGAVFGVTVTRDAGALWLAATTVWSFLLLWLSLAVTGRTPGGAVVGLRVVARDGTALAAGRCAVRVLVLPLSASLLGLGYLTIVLDRERRALHDLLAGSTVVYDWGDAAASLPTPLDRWLRRAGDQPPTMRAADEVASPPGREGAG